MQNINLETQEQFDSALALLENLILDGNKNLTNDEVLARCEEHFDTCQDYLLELIASEERETFSTSNNVTFPFAVVNGDIVLNFTMQTRNCWTALENGQRFIMLSDGVFFGSKRKILLDYKYILRKIINKYMQNLRKVTVLRQDTEPTGL